MVELTEDELPTVVAALHAAAETAQYPAMRKHYAALAEHLDGATVLVLSAHESVTVQAALLKTRQYDLVGRIADRA